MELYVLKSSGILIIMFGFYKLVLENESMHVFKRFYLLGALLVSFLIPLVTFTTYVEMPVTTSPVFMNTGNISFTEIESTANYWPSILWSFYVLGVLYFSIKFGKSLKQLLSRIKNNPKLKRDAITHVLLKNPVVPHTFLSYVFLNKQKYEASEIPKEVIQHEHIHAKQKHTVDILFVELLQILFWFNPLLYFMKRSIKLNHEFLAYRAVLNRGVCTAAYQNLLLAFSSHATTPSLVNSINYSFIKKRFTVMKKQTSTQAIWLKSLLVAPLLAILLYGFSTKEEISKNHSTYSVETKFQQEKATKAEIEEYNELAKKYNTMSRDNMRIVSAEVGRINLIYNKMTALQKENAEPFPRIPAPPLAPVAPRLGEVPPVPPTPLVPSLSSIPDTMELIEMVEKNEGEFYLDDTKVSVDEFKDKLEQIRTSKQNFCITFEKGENNKDRLRIAIQE
jgi:beta-lactamase regulating signal transducer with metallopeptidase domain